MLKKLVVGIAAACVLSAPVYAKHANKKFLYEVTVTNLTNLTNLSKIAIATHNSKFKLFELGQETVPIGLEILAETGLPQTLVDEMLLNDDVKYTKVLKDEDIPPAANNQGVAPGHTLKTTIEADYEFSSISVFSMVAPSNDAFIAANAIKVPRHGKTVTIFSPVYDAGTESNTEFCYEEEVGFDNGLSRVTPTAGFDYSTTIDGLTIDLDAQGENNPDYIPVPTPGGSIGPREFVCRLVDHTEHRNHTGPGASDTGGGPNPTTFHRLPAPPFAQLGTAEGEGRILIHRGIQGVGQLNPAMWDWRNPGAKITIKRIR